MDKIKVLALDDDNHSRAYVTLGSYFSSCAAFIRECGLLNAHTTSYDVREVYICDPQGELATMDEDEFIRLFELLEQDPVKLFQCSPEKWEERNKAFELFWRNGDEWRYA